MKPSVSLIKGLHITAADKRNILAGIAFLTEKFAAFVQADPRCIPNYGDIAIKRGGSNKSYAITPRASAAGTYDVVIREAYKSDFGAERVAKTTVTVAVKGMPPLYLPNYALPDASPTLFLEKECPYDHAHYLRRMRFHQDYRRCRRKLECQSAGMGFGSGL